ncbi:phenylalanine--tRNA ligase subunit beta [Coprothermobacter platensis]|uniref:phenylalanine--tRNA ligase subunit beta n=1 Tax=Coprothermobacter platensis TaxID=108819 RepID=UPI00037C7297|nr:phenylalanine--tRNA ligase subunit beta [Coprothermobacter platensis]
MRFSFNQLKNCWIDGEHVSWNDVRAYLEKHLEVEVEEETPFDVNPSFFLKRVVFDDPCYVTLNDRNVLPLPNENLSSVPAEPLYVLVDQQNGRLLKQEDLPGLPEGFDIFHVLPGGLLTVKGAMEGSLRDILHLPDISIKLSVLPNRGDLSHLYGLAREIALGMGLVLKEPEPHISFTPGNGLVTIETKGCSAYAGLLVEDVHVEESPFWLQYDLIRLGQRPINNVVDLTNYFLLYYGQPMHAFDYDKLEGGRIIVRQAAQGERIVLLSDQEFSLDENCMVIADANKPVAVAGVMGGKFASVSNETKRVLVEVAAFLPSQVAKSSRKLGVKTDASMLYERGVAPCGQTSFAFLFAELMQELGAGTAKGLWFAGKETSQKTVPFNAKRIVTLACASESDLEQMILTKKWRVDEQSQQLVLPSYRWDIVRTEDLVDELVKFVSYDAIPSLPLTEFVPFKEKDSITKENELRKAASIYFQEVFMVSLVSDKDMQSLSSEMHFDMKHAVSVDNPVSRELAFLRPTLLVTLLKAAQLNQNRFQDNVHIFEIGSVFERISDNDVSERRHIGFLVKGSYFDSAPDRRQAWTYRDFKGVLENVLSRTYGLTLKWENAPVDWADAESFSGTITCLGQVVGHLGLIKPSLLKAFDVRGPIFAAELDIDALPLPGERQPQFPLRFPQSWRDFSVVMPQFEPVGKLATLFEGEPLVKSWSVVDMYRGEKIGADEKSVTVRMWLGTDERTITSEEVDEVAKRVLTKLEKAGWHLRS